MASPQDEQGPLVSDDARLSSDTIDTESGSSHIGSDEPERSPVPCPWRTIRFHDQECSRFYDCPSHVVARRSSMEESERASILSTNSTIPSYSEEGEDESSLRNAASFHESAEQHRNDDTLASYQQADSQGYGARLDQQYDTDETMSTEQPASDRDPDEPANPSFSGPPTGLTLTEALSCMDASEIDRRRRNNTQGEHVDNLEGTALRHSSYEAGSERHSPGSPHGHHRRRSMPSRQRMDAPLPSPRDRLPDEAAPRHHGRRHAGLERRESDFSLPRWQPDAEVTYCPICHTQFSFFVRKHHCRKCGRVVCNACSPHRIIIPYQYIVRPPGSELSMPGSLLIDGLGAGYFDVNNMSGGERVRLCNPCVPDPNIAPPRSPASPSPRSTHHRSRSSIGSGYGTMPSAQRYGAFFEGGTSNNPYRYLSSRSRAITMGHTSPVPSHASSSRHRSSTNQTPIGRLFAGTSSSTSLSPYTNRYSSPDIASSSRQRALPPTPQIAEEDECPVCHHELPSRTLSNWESLRESHITACIQSHSTYGTPRSGAGGGPVAAPRRTGMYTYPATEKDCVDDAECTICLEEFTVGVPMARLECLCRFHRSCISAWFVNHPGRCPVHQHDGFGY